MPEDLLTNLRKRDHQSFKILYKKYFRKLFSLAHRLTGNVSEAEDIIQMLFVTVYEKIDQFNSKSDLFTWIYSICLNLCYRHLQQKKHTTFTDIENLIDASTKWDYKKDKYSEEQWFGYITKVRDGCLLALVRCLPFYQRAAFILNVLLKLPLSTVASTLGKSSGSTRVLICRAKQKIRNFLCSNCSAIRETNRCKCMNFIDYAYCNGLIDPSIQKKRSKKLLISSETIQDEIDEMKKVMRLYGDLCNLPPSPDLSKTILNFIDLKQTVLFSRKKV